MSTKPLLTFIFSAFLVTCTNVNSPSEPLATKYDKIEFESFISKELQECILHYIKECGFLFTKDEIPQYSAYFFDLNEKHYFTIWTDLNFPFRLKGLYPDTMFVYCSLSLDNWDITLIHKESYTIDTLLFKSDDECLRYAKKLQLKEPFNGYYDGSLYPETFIYKFDNEKINISNSDTLIIDFLGHGYIEFENYLKNL